MRIHRIDTALPAAPANGYIEVFQPPRNARDMSPQVISLETLGLVNAPPDNVDVDPAVDANIPTTAQFISITPAAATDQVFLPAGSPGKVLRIFVTALGCELVSSVPTDKLNNVVVGATNQGALVAGTLYTLVYNGVDNWVMSGTTATGAAAPLVVPDAIE